MMKGEGDIRCWCVWRGNQSYCSLCEHSDSVMIVTVSHDHNGQDPHLLHDLDVMWYEVSCSRLLLGLASGLSTCGDLAPQHEDGGCLFSVTHHLTYQLMYSRRSRCGHHYTADMHAMFDDVVQYSPSPWVQVPEPGVPRRPRRAAGQAPLQSNAQETARSYMT